MKKIISVFALATCAALLCGGCIVNSDSSSGSLGSAYNNTFEASCPKILTRRNDGGRFTMVRGERSLITLPETPTTGYMWSLESPGKNNYIVGINEITQRYNKSDKSIPGGGRNRQFEITAKNPGVIKIRLENKQQWEKKKKAEEEFEITIRVVNR